MARFGGILAVNFMFYSEQNSKKYQRGKKYQNSKKYQKIKETNSVR